MKWMSKEQIITLQQKVIDRYGGLAGIKNEDMLESALAVPFSGFGDTELCPTIFEKSVRLGFGLVANHPFNDGNKRIGALAFIMALRLNEFEFEATNDELQETIFAVASGEKDYSAFLEWVKEHVREFPSSIVTSIKPADPPVKGLRFYQRATLEEIDDLAEYADIEDLKEFYRITCGCIVINANGEIHIFKIPDLLVKLSYTEYISGMIPIGFIKDEGDLYITPEGEIRLYESGETTEVKKTWANISELLMMEFRVPGS